MGSIITGYDNSPTLLRESSTDSRSSDKAADIATSYVIVDALSLLIGTILSLAMSRSDSFEPEMANADWTLDPIVSATDQAVIPNTIA